MSSLITKTACNFGRVLMHRNAVLNIKCLRWRSTLDHANTKVVPYYQDQEFKRSLEARYPEIEVSRDDFKYVERLIPSATVNDPPQHESYPTPSGWVPQNSNLQPAEYSLVRTRNHMLPIFYRKHFNGRETVKITHIYGDLYKLRDDVVTYLQEQGFHNVDVQVHEVGGFVRFRGNYLKPVAKFLLSKGF